MSASSSLPGIAALLALVPALLAGGFGARPVSPRVFWLALAPAVLGPSCLAIALQSVGWRTGIGPALWLAVATSAIVFAVLAALSDTARRLAPLLAGYLLLVGGLALAWQHVPSRPLRSQDGSIWLLIHVAVALVAYGLVTVAAVAGIAIMLQERAVRLKSPTRFTRSLPAIALGEGLQFRLLAAVEGLLCGALLSGIAINRFQGAGWLAIDHKTVLSLLAFAMIGSLLVLHLRFGVSGRRAARFGLFAYLLLTLAYPGVKLVTDMLIGPRG